MVELVIFGVFCAAVLTCIALGHSILIALAFGLVLFFSYGLAKHHSVRSLFAMSGQGMKTAKTVLLMLCIIGILSAMWRASGCVSYLVCNLLVVCRPEVILLSIFLLCCITSALIGSAFATAGTVGIICMTMANGLGVSLILSGGAILSGIYFGDRWSPLSTSCMLVANITNTDSRQNLTAMAKTMVVPFILCCGIYAAVGLAVSSAAGGSSAAAVGATLSAGFVFHPLLALPAVIVILFALLKAKFYLSMGASIAVAAVLAVTLQGADPVSLAGVALLGFRPESAQLAAMLGGGGFVSTLQTVGIVAISSCYAGLFAGTGLLAGMQHLFERIGAKTTSFVGVTAAAACASLVSCSQTLAIMLTNQLCMGIKQIPEERALELEDTVVIMAALVPWSIAAATPLGIVGAPAAAVLAACYLYLVPAWGAARSLVASAKEKRSRSVMVSGSMRSC